MIKQLIFFLLFIVHVHADEDLEAKNINSLEAPLYVSLGSMCEVSHVLKACNLRKAAFPFDWITTIDSESFLEVLYGDFEFFLDQNFLAVAEKGPGPLLHTYYHMEFLHDGDFRGELYLPTMEKFQKKYSRRIERFRSLADYKGHVIFLRTAFRHSTTDPHRVYFCADNVEITDLYSMRLFNILKQRFPKLHFTLVIINNHNGEGVFEEKRLNPFLIKIRANPSNELTSKYASYRKFFEQAF